MSLGRSERGEFLEIWAPLIAFCSCEVYHDEVDIRLGIGNALRTFSGNRQAPRPAPVADTGRGALVPPSGQKARGLRADRLSRHSFSEGPRSLDHVGETVESLGISAERDHAVCQTRSEGTLDVPR